MSDPSPIALLPESFMFSVATADHQCEAYDPEFEDIRDVWERRRAFTLRGKATDFWNRYPEDIELARNLGCKAFRFSIAGRELNLILISLITQRLTTIAKSLPPFGKPEWNRL